MGLYIAHSKNYDRISAYSTAVVITFQATTHHWNRINENFTLKSHIPWKIKEG